MRFALTVRRLSGVLHARALFNCARVSGVRGARCAPFAMCAWLRSPHARGCLGALPIKERASPASSGSRISRSSHRTLPVLGFATLRLCASRLVSVSASRLRLSVLLSSQSGLSTALVSHLLSSVLLFSQLWSSRSLLCIRLCSAFDSTLHSPLLLVSALHLCLLSTRPHSLRGLPHWRSRQLNQRLRPRLESSQNDSALYCATCWRLQRHISSHLSNSSWFPRHRATSSRDRLFLDTNSQLISKFVLLLIVQLYHEGSKPPSEGEGFAPLCFHRVTVGSSKCAQEAMVYSETHDLGALCDRAPVGNRYSATPESVSSCLTSSAVSVRRERLLVRSQPGSVHKSVSSWHNPSAKAHQAFN